MVICVFVTLMLSVAPVFSILGTAGMVLYITGIINQTQLFAGLVNNGVLSIAMLYVVVHPVVHLPLLKRLFEKVLGEAHRAPGSFGSHPLNTGADALSPEMLSIGKWARFKVCLLSLILSPFLENTPHTAMVTPLLSEHCRKIGLAPSQILMPMTFAVLLGNYFPLGFSSNLVVSGLMEQHNLGELPLWELAKVNLPMAIPVILYLVFAPRYLLPLRRGGITFYARIKVTHTSKLVGNKVAVILKEFIESRTESMERIKVHRRSTVSAVIRSFAWERFSEPFSRIVTIEPGDEIIFGGLTATIGQSSKSPSGLQDEMTTQGAYISPIQAERTDDDFIVQRADDATDHDALIAAEAASGRQRQAGSIIQGTVESSIHDILVASFDYCTPEEPIVSPLAPPSSPRLSTRTSRLDDDRSHLAKLRAFCSDLGVMVMSLKIDHEGANLLKDEAAFSKAPNIATTTRLLTLPRDPDQMESNSPGGDHHGGGEAKPFLAQGKSETEMTWAEWHVYRGGRLFRASIPAWIPLGEVQKPEPQAEPAAPTTDVIDPHLLAPQFGHNAFGKEGQTPKWRIVQMPWWYEYLSLAVFLGIVIAAFFDAALSISCFVANIACVALRLVSTKDLIKALPVEVYLLVAFSFPLGSGMLESGLASKIGDWLVDAHVEGYPLLLLVGAVTLLFTNMITSQGCVQVVFPLVVKVYQARDLHPLPGVMMMLSTLSVALCTPFAIASNAVILVPGGYEPLDYFKFGAPLSIIMLFGLSLSVAAVYDDF
ncbi:sodium/sulphate symporter, putative [Bodo saltans]|uniref:Sodium/sulphate symporter, putative n=1 Tax=Bodo saltans TaxID=75058 RepID=A0A0S4JT76_BODSA|nr:sodium/sulphate symporter, putative [Bodo saltans]|eukprot:CUG92305.1 sodium/sulphate symporter, putative [Bodo saltans]